MRTLALHESVAETPLGVSTRRRAHPSPTEQARRERWGRYFGPLVGQGIRAHIARNGG